jgi:hypothetical protein
MSQEKLYKLLDIIRPDIEKQDATFKLAIPSEERLASCFRLERVLQKRYFIIEIKNLIYFSSI